MENVGRDELRKRIAEMSIFLWKQPTVIKEYDEKLVRRLMGQGYGLRGPGRGSFQVGAGCRSGRERLNIESLEPIQP